MTPQARTPQRRLAAVPTAGEPSRVAVPTVAHRRAADAVLRGEAVADHLHSIVKQTIAQLDEVEHFYVQEARRQGEGHRIWDSAGWMVANAIARTATAAEQEPTDS